jgi:hypothetical protein
MPMPHGRHDLQAAFNLLSEKGAGPGLDPVGGEFQPSFETVHPGGGAHLFSELQSFFRVKSKV